MEEIQEIQETQEMTADEINNQILDWCSGDWIPTSKVEEDEFLSRSSVYIDKNCKKNPGMLGEWATCQILGGCRINQRIDCNWLGDQQYIKPDIVRDDLTGEVKTLRYFNCEGKRGNQGTGPEKLDSIFRKYIGVNGKKMIILVADQQFEKKNGLMFLEAFNNSNYSNNRHLEHNVPFWKSEGFEVISFKELRSMNQ